MYPGAKARLSYLETIASTTTITPRGDLIAVSGTNAIATITPPPQPFNTVLFVIPTGIFTLDTTGNIALAATAVVSKVMTLVYEKSADKWYPSYTS